MTERTEEPMSEPDASPVPPEGPWVECPKCARSLLPNLHHYCTPVVDPVTPSQKEN